MSEPVIGKQYYAFGINHPQTTPDQPGAPAVTFTDPTTNQTVIVGPDGVTPIPSDSRTTLTAIVGGHSFAVGHAAIAGDNVFRQGYGAAGGAVWAQDMTDGALSLVYMAGVGGNNTTQYLARLQEDVLSKPGLLATNYIGVNDFSTTANVPFAQTQSNLVDIWQRQKDAGKIPLQCLVGPVNTTLLPQFAARAAEIPVLNAWIVEYARNNPWLLVADTYSASVDPTSANGFPKADDVVDGLHKSPIGARRDGIAIKAAISRLLPLSSPGRVSSNLDSRALSALSNQLVTNPMLLGTGGTKIPGSGTITGDAPDGWTAQIITGTGAEVILSFVTPESGIGRGLRVQITAPNAAEVAINSNAMAALVAAGDVVDGICDLEITAISGCRVQLQNRRNIGGANVDVNSLFSYSALPNMSAVKVSPKLPRSAVQSGTITLFSSRLFFQLSAGGSADVIFSRPELRKIS